MPDVFSIYNCGTSHNRQFRKTFPQVWLALDHGVSAAGQPAFASAVAALKNSAPTTYLSLEKTGILN